MLLKQSLRAADVGFMVPTPKLCARLPRAFVAPAPAPRRAASRAGGSHVILDVQSGALSLLRVEGHLEVDLSRQDACGAAAVRVLRLLDVRLELDYHI